MQKIIQLKMLPHDAADDTVIKQQIASATGKDIGGISGYRITRRSIDGRNRQPFIILTLQVYFNEQPKAEKTVPIRFRDVSRSKKSAVIIGAGPAGLFGALKCIEQNIRPIVLERGKDIRARRRDLALLNKEGLLHPDSNYCFGEGGAGTYSDGKLYTRSTKRGDVRRILELLVQFGADENILIDAHPHIGTNKLPQIITAIRQQILECGGQVLFEKKVDELVLEKGQIRFVKTTDGEFFDAAAVILATGHSARDIFLLLAAKKIQIEFKPFALGVRIEHPQALIDQIQYHCAGRDRYLPPASYSLVEQIHQRGVFSFCMCPGGIIAPAATSQGEIVVNGWSPSKRNNPFANSGLVTSISEKDVAQFSKKGALAGMYFQQSVEEKAFRAGGGLFVAPAQRMVDFGQKNMSTSLPDCSYLPGISPSLLHEVLPPFVFEGLRDALVVFGKKMKGYYTNEAVLVGTESRTSSPVRIPRDPDSSRHPQISNLYPCGEGAGYAGGIVSAAMDGEKVADHVAKALAAS